MSSGWPLRVVSVDAAEIGEITSERPAGGEYVGAWVIVRRDGHPCGIIEVEFGPDGRVDPVELERLVARLPVPATVFSAAAVPGAAVPGAAVPGAAGTAAALPSLSVIIPTDLERPDGLRRTLTSLAAASYPGIEVIVVDNRSTGGGDPMPSLLAEHPGVLLVREPQPGSFAARNAGVAASTGEIVAFTDDDVEVDPGWPLALGRRFAARPDEDAVTGLIVPAELETAAQVWFEHYWGGFAARRQYLPLSFASAVSAEGRRLPWLVVATDDAARAVRTFPVYGAGAIGAGANMAFRREALVGLGGFDTALGTGTPARGGGDLAAFMTLLWQGGRMGFEPAAMVMHRHRRTEAGLRRQLHSYGIGFTAILVSLIHHDRRHLAGIARQLPAALRRYGERFASRRETGGPAQARPAVRTYPRYLHAVEIAGYLRGPSRYVASVRAVRRWRG